MSNHPVQFVNIPLGQSCGALRAPVAHFDRDDSALRILCNLCVAPQGVPQVFSKLLNQVFVDNVAVENPDKQVTRGRGPKLVSREGTQLPRKCRHDSACSRRLFWRHQPRCRSIAIRNQKCSYRAQHEAAYRRTEK